TRHAWALAAKHEKAARTCVSELEETASLGITMNNSGAPDIKGKARQRAIRQREEASNFLSWLS
ncbi:hypothetical protein BaRGS_00035784, partial [Batillaria attramentaria]